MSGWLLVEMADLALEGLYRQVDNHVRLEGLLLDEALEAHVTLERSDTVVDEHVPLQVGRQRELARAHVTLVTFNPLQSPNTRGGGVHYSNKSQVIYRDKRQL